MKNINKLLIKIAIKKSQKWKSINKTIFFKPRARVRGNSDKKKKKKFNPCKIVSVQKCLRAVLFSCNFIPSCKSIFVRFCALVQFCTLVQFRQLPIFFMIFYVLSSTVNWKPVFKSQINCVFSPITPNRSARVYFFTAGLYLAHDHLVVLRFTF